MDRLNIFLQQGQKVFFSSDQHFWHRNVLRFCQRPFTDIKEMGETLIENWNRVVSPGDIVFTLGDLFWFENTRDIVKILNKLNGEIHIVPGNHDTEHMFSRVNDPRITVHDSVVTVYLRNWFEDSPQKPLELYLTHVPAMTWPHRGQPNVYHFFGHIHSGPRCENAMDSDLPLWPTMYDVGVDNNEYTPIELGEILKKLNND